MNTSEDHNVLKLVWCSPHPNHYNSYLFEHLASIPNVTFEAVYFYKRLTNYPWTSSFEGSYSIYYLKKIMGIDFSFLWSRRKKRKELFIIAGWNEPTMIAFLLYLIFTQRTFLLFSDTPRIRETKGLREHFRKLILNILFKKMFRFLVTGTTGIARARQLGIPDEKNINYPFATNTDFFVPHPDKKPLSNEPLIILSSGRLDNAHKGYDVGILALGKLKKDDPSLNFRYLIAGEGPDKEVLRQMIQENDLTKEVTLLGWLEPKDLLSFYHSGDVFLHPSHEDPFPNAVLEAMACGLPVIGSEAAGSVIDRVVNDKNGYSHKDGNVDDLYQKIRKVMSLSVEQLNTMSQSARETALQWKVTYHQGVMQRIIQEYSQEL
ncbi:MAG: glycosyltransferase [Chitinophagaceae bacterium]|nr:glycosyltransferase [Chitinophagaceae bacterium]